uniref:Uncharacterized protein n=1 Tax=Romanomermis culicivorax TaxID=13658 RepID=A0A915IKR5_ROMCU
MSVENLATIQASKQRGHSNHINYKFLQFEGAFPVAQLTQLTQVTGVGCLNLDASSTQRRRDIESRHSNHLNYELLQLRAPLLGWLNWLEHADGSRKDGSRKVLDGAGPSPE